MPMKIKDLIYAKTGIAVDLDSLVNDPDTQDLIAACLALMAKSDGGISPDELQRMVELLREQFMLQPGEALNMIARATDAVAENVELGELLESVNDELALAHKEELLLMLLHVISADDRKDVAEMKLLAAVIEGLRIPQKIVDTAYTRYFADRKGNAV